MNIGRASVLHLVLAAAVSACGVWLAWLALRELGRAGRGAAIEELRAQSLAFALASPACLLPFAGVLCTVLVFVVGKVHPTVQYNPGSDWWGSWAALWPLYMLSSVLAAVMLFASWIVRFRAKDQPSFRAMRLAAAASLTTTFFLVLQNFPSV